MISLRSLFCVVLLAMSSTAFAEKSAYEIFKAKNIQKQSEFRANYKSRYEAFKAKVSQKWGTGTELSDDNSYVVYSEDLSTKTVVDFANNEVRVESLNDAKKVTPEELRKTAQDVINTPINQLASKDPILKGTKPEDSRTLAEAFVPGVDTSNTLSEPLSVENVSIEVPGPSSSGELLTDVTQKNITRVTLSVDGENLFHRRAEPYLTKVIEQAEKYNLDPAVLLAIMQVESSFNPLAQSSIPAYGLMQIVPESAGEDVNVRVFGKTENKVPSKDQLLTPNRNIEFGAAYFHLLYSIELGRIQNPLSRLYCTIAAYNTGAGNLARTFHPEKAKKLDKAIEAINQLKPEQVYTKLIKELPYTETREYLERVTLAVPDYTRT